MASPISVGTTAIVVAPINQARALIRFQNTSAVSSSSSSSSSSAPPSSNIIYIKKIPLSGAYPVVSATNYDVRLFAGQINEGLSEIFETNSIASFMAVSSAASGVLAVYETINV